MSAQGTPRAAGNPHTPPVLELRWGFGSGDFSGLSVAADGVPETKKGARRSATPKVSTMTNIKKLPTLEGLWFIQEGPCRWTPAQANAVFNKCRYGRNRSEKQGEAHIDALARQMIDGTWLTKSPIDFARLPDGKITLVNGHHRMLAQVRSGRDIVWNVVIHDCADEDEIANLFWRFDTVMRKRSMTNILSGVNAAENMGLSKSGAVALARAVVFIDGGMRPLNGPASRNYTPAEKLRLMTLWQAEGIAYEKCVEASIRGLRRKLFGAQVMAVGLVTLRADEVKAEEFWRGVASDDGLHRGDPRKTLVDFLRDTHAASGGLTSTAAAVARAWAAWDAGRDLSMIRVGRQPVQIARTKIVVQP
jgi:hypothetical protein